MLSLTHSAQLDGARGMLKVQSIEALLQWAYREELPKGYRQNGGALSISPMFRLADLGTPIDDWSREPGFPLNVGTEPHPDALRIDYAVRSLERIGGEIRKADPDPPSERSGRRGFLRERTGSDIINLADYISDGLPPGWSGNLSSAIRTFEPGSLLIHYAQLGARPQWDLGPLHIEPARGSRKQPEISFLDQDGNRIKGSKRGGYYSPGACCEVRFDPAPFQIALARTEYLVWYVAMMEVTRLLSTASMIEFRPSPPTAAALPWRTGEIDKRRIFHSITVTMRMG